MKRPRFSIRYQLLLLYMTVVVTVCLTYLPMSLAVRDRLLTYYKQQTQQLFERNVETLSHSISLLYNVNNVMGDFSYYRECLAYKGNVAPILPKMYMAQRVLSDYLTSIPLLDRAFLYFPNTGTVIDDQMLYINVKSFAEYGIQAKDGSDVEALLKDNGVFFHQFDNVQLSTKMPQGALALFFSLRHSENLRVGAVLNNSTLSEVFSLSNYPQGSSLYVYDGDGMLFYQHGTVVENSVLFEDQIELPLIRIKLQIPQAYFDHMLISYDHLFNTTLTLTLVVGIALSIVLTCINYRPVKRLMNRLDKQFMLQRKNEYEIINDHLQQCDMQISTLGQHLADLQSNLRASIFARLLTSNISDEKEIELSISLLPMLKEEIILVIVCMNTDESDEPLLFAPFGFMEELGGYYQQMTYNQAVMLLRASDETIGLLHATLEKQQERLNTAGVTIISGVSERFAGIENVYIAYRQASLAMSNHELISCYVSNTQLTECPATKFREMQYLYEILLAGENPERFLRGLLDRLAMRKAIRGEYGQFAELVNYVCASVAADLQLENVDLSILSDVHHQNPDELVEQAIADVNAVVNCIQTMRSHSERESHKTVMRWLREHFDQPDCCAETIAQAVKMSTNSVYQIVREQTGHSLGEMIEELRVEKACQLLSESNMTVAEIAGACGYLVPATFYRCFKRIRGITPSQYRKNNEANE